MDAQRVRKDARLNSDQDPVLTPCVQYSFLAVAFLIAIQKLYIVSDGSTLLTDSHCQAVLLLPTSDRHQFRRKCL